MSGVLVSTPSTLVQFNNIQMNHPQLCEKIMFLAWMDDMYVRMLKFHPLNWSHNIILIHNIVLWTNNIQQNIVNLT